MNLHAKTLMVKIKVENGQHNVVDAWLLEKNYPASFAPVSQRATVNYRVLDANAKTLKQGQAYSPTAISGAYLLATEEEKAELAKQNSIPQNSSYYIRVANYQPEMHELRLQSHSLVRSKRSTTQEKGFVLANWLK